MPTINNIEFLTLPQQVQKNKRDVADIKTELADTAVSVAGEFSNVYIGLGALGDRIDDADDIISELVTSTEDTGWLPLTITNAAVSTDPLKTAMFIRKIGDVVSITGKFEFISAYTQYPPSGYLVQLPSEYKPYRNVQVTCYANKYGTETQVQLNINGDNGYMTLTTAQTLDTIIYVRGIMYLAQ